MGKRCLIDESNLLTSRKGERGESKIDTMLPRLDPDVVVPVDRRKLWRAMWLDGKMELREMLRISYRAGRGEVLSH